MSEFDPAMLNDPRAMRNAFGTFMTGVTVVTSYDADGTPLGFTANSFTSVSLDPPLVLVCLANSSSNYESFANAQAFGINILSEEQIDVSNTFARPSEDRFAAIDWNKGPNGSPILDGVSAWFDCAMHKTVDAGDHLIMIGEVKAYAQTVAPGLGYARGAYVTPAAEARALSANSPLVVSALIERDGKVLLVGDTQGRLTLPTTSDAANGASRAIQKLIEDSGVTAEPGFVYSVYEDEARKHQHIAFLCSAADGEPTKGVFTELTENTLADIADPAMCAMLERFAQESQVGNFGVYCGNEVSGEVKSVAHGSI